MYITAEIYIIFDNCMMVESSVIFPFNFLHVHVLLDVGMQDGENQER